MILKCPALWYLKVEKLYMSFEHQNKIGHRVYIEETPISPPWRGLHGGTDTEAPGKNKQRASSPAQPDTWGAALCALAANPRPLIPFGSVDQPLKQSIHQHGARLSCPSTRPQELCCLRSRHSMLWTDLCSDPTERSRHGQHRLFLQLSHHSPLDMA